MMGESVEERGDVERRHGIDGTRKWNCSHRRNGANLKKLLKRPEVEKKNEANPIRTDDLLEIPIKP